jgi:hypothetical protein
VPLDHEPQRGSAIRNAKIVHFMTMSPRSTQGLLDGRDAGSRAFLVLLLAR